MPHKITPHHKAVLTECVRFSVGGQRNSASCAFHVGAPNNLTAQRMSSACGRHTPPRSLRRAKRNGRSTEKRSTIDGPDTSQVFPIVEVDATYYALSSEQNAPGSGCCDSGYNDYG
jgi:hypothetical protein